MKILGLMVILTGSLLSGFSKTDNVHNKMQLPLNTLGVHEREPVYWGPFMGSIMVVTGVLMVVKGRRKIHLT